MKVEITKSFQVKRNGEITNSYRDGRIKHLVEVMNNKTVYIAFWDGHYWKGVLVSLKQLENILKEANRK